MRRIQLSNRADDPRQHARQRRAVARRVVLAVPPSGDPERGPVARSRASAIVRPAHGVHPLWHHRRGCAAELAGTAARETLTGCNGDDHAKPGLSGEQRRALNMLAGSPHGCTEAALRAHGFTVVLLAKIVRTGLAVANPEIVKAGGRTLSMLRLTITDAGRQACQPLQLPPNARDVTAEKAGTVIGIVGATVPK